MLTPEDEHAILAEVRLLPDEIQRQFVSWVRLLNRYYDRRAVPRGPH